MQGDSQHFEYTYITQGSFQVVSLDKTPTLKRALYYICVFKVLAINPAPRLYQSLRLSRSCKLP